MNISHPVYPRICQWTFGLFLPFVYWEKICHEHVCTTSVQDPVFSQVVQMVKCLPAMWETQVPSLGWEDPLEKEMTPHSRTLAWKIPWMEEPGGLQSMGLQRVGLDRATSLSVYTQKWNCWNP